MGAEQRSFGVMSQAPATVHVDRDIRPMADWLVDRLMSMMATETDHAREARARIARLFGTDGKTINEENVMAVTNVEALGASGEWLKRRCGCVVPSDVKFDECCQHDVAADQALRSAQVDSHPGGHHTFVLPSARCSCGLVYKSTAYEASVPGSLPGEPVPVHRRYFGDVVV